MIVVKVRELEVYESNGRKPFDTWLARIKDRVAKARILRRLDQASEGNFGKYRYLGEIYELKENYGPGYRIYLAIEKDRVLLLLLGGDKSTQTGDIEKAKEVYREYKTRRK